MHRPLLVGAHCRALSLPPGADLSNTQCIPRQHVLARLSSAVPYYHIRTHHACKRMRTRTYTHTHTLYLSLCADMCLCRAFLHTHLTCVFAGLSTSLCATGARSSRIRAHTNARSISLRVCRRVSLLQGSLPLCALPTSVPHAGQFPRALPRPLLNSHHAHLLERHLLPAARRLRRRLPPQRALRLSPGANGIHGGQLCRYAILISWQLHHLYAQLAASPLTRIAGSFTTYTHTQTACTHTYAHSVHERNLSIQMRKVSALAQRWWHSCLAKVAFMVGNFGSARGVRCSPGYPFGVVRTHTSASPRRRRKYKSLPPAKRSGSESHDFVTGTGERSSVISGGCSPIGCCYALNITHRFISGLYKQGM